jgi:hypothetical protein
MSSLPKVLVGLKVAAEEAVALITDISITENAPARLKIAGLIFGDVAGVLAHSAHLPAEADRAVLLAKDGCECLAACAGDAYKADEVVCAERIEIVLRKVSIATAQCYRFCRAGQAVPEVPEVTIAQAVLIENGYTEIVDQDGEGEVTLRNDSGGLEVFALRDSYAGWSIPTDQGKVLEFCRSI